LRLLALALLVLVFGAIAAIALYAFYSLVSVAKSTAQQLIVMAAGITAMTVMVGLLTIFILIFIGAEQAREAKEV
jgi:hypothetical protein